MDQSANRPKLSSKIHISAKNTFNSSQALLKAMEALNKLIHTNTFTDCTEQVFNEFLDLHRSIENNCIQVVREADTVWDEYLKEVRQEAVSESDINMLAVKDKLLIQDCQESIQSACDMLVEIRRAFGEKMLQTISQSDFFTPHQLIDIGKVSKAFITDLVPFYGTLTEILKITKIVNLDKTWTQLATPFREEIIVSTLGKSKLQTDIIFNYVKLTFNLIELRPGSGL